MGMVRRRYTDEFKRGAFGRQRAAVGPIAGTPSVCAVVSASRKFQIEFASGTRSASVSPRKRMNDRRSLIRYSVRSSESEWLAWRTKTLNIRTWS
jgi:hypothetical protein